ncbi:MULTISPECIES: cytochrome P450 [unclassified Pseudonocardia]|jgi:cytochrome P450|uniref:cytochrome P450 n=1 Tax=unclassified Pseudonocardia TaxID=2619320 RepID=UPI0009670630|nr:MULTISPECIES: cytochrome P450 [unclassified Pseudonocardia]MBN9097528.1 cytochrome P450 [Pseudonocardia sp.]OJY39851.1 MAG: cytochrome [Pseudonocardia sp. 73-21]
MTRTFHDLDISSLKFWAQPPAERDAVFAQLRRQQPVSWHRPAETELLPNGEDPGFWALTRNADIVAVSRNAEVFASGQEFGGVMLEDVPEDVLEAAHSILAMDAPRHAKQRKLISSVFTPRRVAKIEEQIRAQARGIVDTIAPLGEIDFVEQVSARLPVWTISEMIGIEEADRDRVAAAANAMVSWNDAEFVGDGDAMGVLLDALMTLHTTAFGLVEARRAEPRDDLITALVQAEIDGEQLTEEEIASFFVLLCVAGNDTTRQTSTHAILALQEFPDQKAALLADFDGRIGTAVEEFVRWASPVMTFRRTARVDVTIGDQHIRAGEKVALFYRSGNFDETAFEAPERFDVTRSPNPHVGFGGGGPHFCLGSHLARMQLSALFGELLTRLPDLTVGEPEYLAGNFINGIKRLPARFTPMA